MEEAKLEPIRQEATRLLRLQAKLLEEMLETDGLIVDAAEGEHQTFDRHSTAKQLEVISGELVKLENLDLVLAVVGTMKAGKSTTINAIVGTEVLPNRNRPMTALPTLIRHTPGQVEPVLRFDNCGPVNALLQSLQAKVKKTSAKKLAEMTGGNDVSDLLETVQEKRQFPARCNGADEIFLFLRRLNDLVRLAALLGSDFPFDSYDEIHEMPVIEVEFSHLRGMDAVAGRLTLLDTPGPNEAGQPHLRRMLQEQLKKASAILAVMDFTQLKSDADEQVRADLEQILQDAEGRLHVLVNKFDQKDRHSDTAESVREYVSIQLMGGRIDGADVYPVSSRQGYLANRALHELDVHERLPDASSAAWVADFGEEAFGRRWQSLVHDSTEVKSGAEELWAESGFDKPLSTVIRSAHARAAVLAVHSSTAKLRAISADLEQFLGLRHSALKRSSVEVSRQARFIAKDLQAMAESEKEAIKIAKAALKKFRTRSDKLFAELERNSLEALTGFFREGRKLETQELAVVSPKTAGQRARKSPGDEIRTHGLFDPSQPKLRLANTRQVDHLLHGIERAVEAEVSRAERRVNDELAVSTKEFQGQFDADVLKGMEALVTGLNERMVAEEFVVSLALPKLKKLKLKFCVASSLDQLVEENTELQTRRRRATGVWGRICGFFNTDDFGYESYDVSSNYYVVDLRKVEKAVLKGVSQAFRTMERTAGGYLEELLTASEENFFEEIRGKLTRLEGDLQQSLRDHESGEEQQAALLNRLARLIKKNPAADVVALHGDLGPLARVQSQSEAA